MKSASNHVEDDPAFEHLYPAQTGPAVTAIMDKNALLFVQDNAHYHRDENVIALFHEVNILTQSGQRSR